MNKIKKAMKDGFDICFDFKDHLKNVIASGEFCDSDKIHLCKADNFISEYKNILKIIENQKILENNLKSLKKFDTLE